MKIFNRNIVIFVCLFLVAALFLSCASKGRVEADSGYQIVMGTFAHIVAVAQNAGTAKDCIRTALEEIHKVDNLMSDYKSDSDISRANREAYEKPVQVSEQTFEVLQHEC